MDLDIDIISDPTLVAFQFNDGVVIGAETRTCSSDGSVSNRFADKLVKIREKVYCCGAGFQSYLQRSIDLAKYALYVYEINSGSEASVRDVAKIFQQICRERPCKSNYAFIIVGFDSQTGGEVYSLANGMLHQEPIAILGSGGQCAFAHVKQAYGFGMDQPESVKFVVDAIKCGINNDMLSGGYVNIAVITEEGVERKIVYNTGSGSAIDTV